MAQQIFITPEKLWDYYLEHEEELQYSRKTGYRGDVIAQNDDSGIVVLITNDDGIGKIVVYADGVQIYSEEVVSDADCRVTAAKIYNEYTTKDVLETLSALGDDEGFTRFEMEDMISEREDELDMVFDDLLSALGIPYDEEILGDVKEHTLEYIYRKFGVEIYRPMFLEDENGEEFFEEFPYDNMVFDDE